MGIVVTRRPLVVPALAMAAMLATFVAVELLGAEPLALSARAGREPVRVGRP